MLLYDEMEGFSLKKRKLHKTNAMRILEERHIEYKLYEYPWKEDHLDAEMAAVVAGVPKENMYKTLVAVGDKTDILIACLPSNHEINLKALAKVSHNKKVTMLPMKDLEKVTGYIRGGCSPVGMIKQYPTFIAEDAEHLLEVVVSAGKRGVQMGLKPNELQTMTKGIFANFSSV